jgi:hypothetical protein
MLNVRHSDGGYKPGCGKTYAATRPPPTPPGTPPWPRRGCQLGAPVWSEAVCRACCSHKERRWRVQRGAGILASGRAILIRVRCPLSPGIARSITIGSRAACAALQAPHGGATGDALPAHNAHHAKRQTTRNCYDDAAGTSNEPLPKSGARDVGGDAAGARGTSSDPEMKRAPGEGRPEHATRNDARNARKFSRDRLLRRVVGIPRSTTSTRSMIAIRISARDASGLTSITPYWRYRSTAMAVTGRAERSRCDRRVPNRARVRWRPEWRRY